MVRRSILLVNAGLAMVSFLSACSPTAEQSTEPTLGIALAETSNVALVGQEQLSGVKIAETYFNGQGGINGTPLKLIYQDTGADEATAINAFQTLINTNRVIGIVGPTLSQQAFSAAPLAERAKVPVLAPSTIAPGIPQLGEFISRLGTDASFTAPIAIKAALQLNANLNRVAVLYAQDQEAQVSESKFFQQAVLAEGLTLLPPQKFNSTDTDFQAQASQVINARPDLVVISSLVADGANLVKQLRQLGYRGLIVGGNGLNTSNIFPVCQALCDGILVAQAYSPANPIPINQTFVSLYRQQYQKQPPLLSAQGFAAVQVFVQALIAVDQKQKITSLALADLRQQLNQQLLAGQYETPLGPISFTAEGDILQKDFYVAQVKMQPGGERGEFKFLPTR